MSGPTRISQQQTDAGLQDALKTRVTLSYFPKVVLDYYLLGSSVKLDP